MNNVTLSGHLTDAVETRDINGKQIAKFTLAHNEGERVLFLPVEAWDKEHLAEYLDKGSKVVVAGRLKQNNWETDKGEKRSRIVLIAQRVEFMSPESANGVKRREPRDGRNGAQRMRSRAA